MASRREFIKHTAAASAFVAGDTLPSTTAEGADRKDRSAASGTRSLRLAIVGTGEISPRYLKDAMGNERARFVATCARTLESARSRAVEFRIDAWFDDYRRMYDVVKPDAVVVVTPHVLHAEHSIAAMKRGIHVLCEKPMATRWEDCQAMVEAAQRSGVVFLNMPYDATPPFLAALSHLNEVTLGAFTGAEANLSLPGGTRIGSYDRRAGEGAMLSVLVYPVNKLVSLLGPAKRVTGFVNTLIPHRLLGDGKTIDFKPPPRDSRKKVESTTDDNVSLVIEWPTGQQAMVRSLWGTSFFISTAAVYGRHGTLWFAAYGNDIIIHSPEKVIPNAEPIAWHGLKDCYKVAIKETRKNEGLIDHFVDCIKGKAQPTCGGEQQLHVHEILFKGYEAASTGHTQELKTTFKPWHSFDPAFLDTRSRFI